MWRDKIGERESISEWRLRDREKERERELWFGRTGVSEAHPRHIKGAVTPSLPAAQTYALT